MFKEQKGITLVALVITIIVLLILAGVSISLVVGQDGVLGRAQNAVSSTEQATAEQEIQLSMAEAQMEYMNAWTGNQAVKPREYYSQLKYYTNNCTSAVSVDVAPESANSDNMIVTYLSKSNVTYTAKFNCTQANKTFVIEAKVNN